MLADELALPLAQLSVYWPDRVALHYDCLLYHAVQVDEWRNRVRQDDAMDAPQKLLARYQILAEHVEQQRYPGCLVYRRLQLLSRNGAPHPSTGGPAKRRPTATPGRYW